jgi:YkoY family integral membrane protein
MMVPGIADIALIAWYIGVLVLLEGLLSADNALVLAVMVRHLPKNQQRRVLFWGIWGAIVFRGLALLLSSVLLKFWICKVIGGGYLLYLALSHFLAHKASSVGTSEGESSKNGRWLRSFWGTVTSITLADIAFSIDSILAAVAMAEGFPGHFGENGKLFIVFVGGVLGIITMRFVVRYFLVLLERFPGLEEGAYYLVAWIGLKLLISGFYHAEIIGFHIPESLFWLGMLVIAAASLVVKPRGNPGGGSGVSESLDLLDSAAEESGEEHGHDSPAQPHVSVNVPEVGGEPGQD